MTSTRIYFVDSKGKILSAKWLDGPVDNEDSGVARVTDVKSSCEARPSVAQPVPIT